MPRLVDTPLSMKVSREYASDVQRRRSANSPWRTQTMVATNKAVAKRKKVEQTPAGTPRPDLD